MLLIFGVIVSQQHGYHLASCSPAAVTVTAMPPQKKKKLITCLVCRRHRSRKRRKCSWCNLCKALPDCQPEACYDHELEMCSPCAIEFLEALPCVVGQGPAGLILEFYGYKERYHWRHSHHNDMINPCLRQMVWYGHCFLCLIHVFVTWCGLFIVFIGSAFF